jgi:hypothetical protein
MSEPRKGVRVPLSPARKIVGELLHHARKVPSLPLKRPLNVAALAAARAGSPHRPSWVGLFLKAYAQVALTRPELRRSYVPFPRPHLYEHPTSECAVLVERDWADEKAVLAAKIRAPEHQPLAAIDAHLKRFGTAPFDEVSDLRQLARLARLPAFARRFVFWNTLNLSGYKRSKRFGTFMVSSLGNQGVEQVHPLTPLTTYLSFGPIDPCGNVTALIVYDHRVMDGRAVAAALVDLEAVLNGPILAEVQGPARTAAA